MHSPPDPREVCVVTLQAARPGGVPTVVDWWCRFLKAWGHQPTVLHIAFEEGQVRRLARLMGIIKGWRLHPLPGQPNPTLVSAALPLPVWGMYAAPQWLLGNVLNRWGAHVFAGGACHAALPLALKGTPYILWIGTLYEEELRGKALSGDAWAAMLLSSPFWPLMQWQEKLVLRRAARVLVQSHATRQAIAARVPEVLPKTEVILVPAAQALPTPAQPIARHFPTLLNISRINDPRKNIPMLLRAFAQVHQALPQARLILAGEAPAPHLSALVEELGLGQAVSFPGRVDESQRDALYRSADLFTLSSTQEGLGIVMLEAMACGCPVLATDCGGPLGIVTPGETGQIVPNDDAHAFAAAALSLLSDQVALDEMRARCRAFIAQQASPEVVGQKLRAHFEAVFSPVEEGRVTRVGLALAALWGGLIVGAYLVRQAAILWPSIQARIVAPLLERLN